MKTLTDRKLALSRIWKAIQVPTPEPARPVAPTTPGKPKASKEAKPKAGAPPAHEGSKKAIVLALLRRPEGATLAEIQSDTNWKSHSIRGFISGALGKKMGLKIESAKREDGNRCYRVA